MKNFSLDFVGVGPQRTGTSWLHQLLAHHHALCLPRDVDEPMFFDLYYEKGFDRYINYFAHRKEGQLCGEFSPTYFDIAIVPARIHQLNPACKIIVNLRNPVARVSSLYRHHWSKGRVNGSFSHAVQQMPRLVDSGRYSQHIPRWLDTFGEAQVTFVVLDDVQACPEAVLNHINRFLGIPQCTMNTKGYEKFNALTMPRFHWLARLGGRVVTELHARGLHEVVNFGKALGLRNFVYSGGQQNKLPDLELEDQLQLLEKYEKDINFVERLLDRDLSAWRQVA